jgi:hypothetical protein
VTDIGKYTVHEIIPNVDINFHEVSVRWIPEMLTEEHNSGRSAAALENPCHYQDKGK